MPEDGQPDGSAPTTPGELLGRDEEASSSVAGRLAPRYERCMDTRGRDARRSKSNSESDHVQRRGPKVVTGRVSTAAPPRRRARLAELGAFSLGHRAVRALGGALLKKPHSRGGTLLVVRGVGGL